jgi:site-specific DNA-methyltransferase (adenine-specific)
MRASVYHKPTEYRGTPTLKPYYSREGITLYHGDCAEMEVDCDLLVTDPPYGQEFKSGWAKTPWGVIEGDNNLEGTTGRLRHAIRKLRRHRHAYIFGHKFDFSDLPLMGITEIIWDKEIVGPGDLSCPWGPQHEKITFAVHESSKANRALGRGNLSARLRKGSVLRCPRANSAAIKHHPTEKPVYILRQLIESSSVMGEIVYDPFAGSGSTLIAAALEARIAVGCEFEERYCEIAANRFEREIAALSRS